MLAGAFVVAVCIGILGLSSWHEWEARTTALRTAETDMANLARSLTQHAEDTFDILDASIVGIVTRLEAEGAGPEKIPTLVKILDARKAGFPRIAGMFIFDENGNVLATSERVNAAVLNASDRDYFQNHRQFPSRAVSIGTPVKSRTGGGWVITVSRRFNRPDGSFAGVVLATIGSDYFFRFYQQFAVGAKGSITLLSAGGIIFARTPDNDANVGRDLSKGPLFQEANIRPLESTYYFKSPIDGLERLSFYKRSDRFRFVVVATMSRDEVLGRWRKTAISYTAMVLALVALISVIGLFLVRQLHLRQRLVSALVGKEADFRLLAEESSDMVTRIALDGRLLYVSPSSARVVGWDAEQLTGTSALAGINPDDLPEVNRMVAALKSGEMTEARFVYRSRHRELREVWIESNMRITRNPETDEIDGVVAISRDVTDQKAAAEKLAALAALDGLTGLANRRRFDERLQEEWARSRRDGTSLSLLMVDVDHFKKFNDRYGHQAGDDLPAAGGEAARGGSASPRRSCSQIWRRGVRAPVAGDGCRRLSEGGDADPAWSSAAWRVSYPERSFAKGDGEPRRRDGSAQCRRPVRTFNAAEDGRPGALFRQAGRARPIGHGRRDHRAIPGAGGLISALSI